MATPIYDPTVLPKIILPFENTHTASKRYLGNQALTGKVRAAINIICQTDAEMNAVHTFWRVDCNYGLEVFIINMPQFGFDTTAVDFLVQFTGDFKPTKDKGCLWKIKLDLKILAPVFIVTDDNGDAITDDAGGIIYSNNSLDPSTDNIITYTPTTEVVI